MYPQVLQKKTVNVNNEKLQNMNEDIQEKSCK